MRVLAISGGGIRGVLPARVLQEIERRAHKPIGQMFDLLAGTSTGGIIAVGLLHGIAAADLAHLYSEHGGEIFDRSLLQDVTSVDGLRRPKYSAASLEGILIEMLGNTWLSETKGPHLLVPTCAVTRPEALFFKSWKCRHDGAGEPLDDLARHDYPLWQICRATSAAPTYFPCATVVNRRGDEPMMCVDGGLFANDPSACALASARRLWPDEDVELVSIGTGGLETPVMAKTDWGAVDWLPHIVSLMMDCAADATTYQLDQDLIGQMPSGRRRYTKIEFDMTGPDAPNSAMDDASPENLKRLDAVAHRWITDNSAVIDACLS